MKRYCWIILSNCEPGREEEFNRWYEEVHLPDLLRVPGVISAERFHHATVQTKLVDGDLKLVDVAGSDMRHQFAAIYWIETDDIAAVLDDIRRRSGTSDMVISSSLLEASALCFAAFDR